MASNQGGWTTYALTAISSVLITGTLGWFTLAGKAVTADEVREIVTRSSPYIEDRKAIQATVDVLQNVDEHFEAQISAVDERLRNIEASLVRIETMIKSWD